MLRQIPMCLEERCLCGAFSRSDSQDRDVVQKERPQRSNSEEDTESLFPEKRLYYFPNNRFNSLQIIVFILLFQ